MVFELNATTSAGARFQAAAQKLVPVFRERAAAADRDGVMCQENLDDLVSSKIVAAFVPEALGGMGVESVHDWLVGIATLARGDGSTAIAINMHHAVSRGMAQAWRATEEAARQNEPLAAIAAGEMLICATATERGTDNLHPLTTATRCEEGWQIDGSKMFVTMSPIATHLAMNLRLQDDTGDHLGSTMMPIDTPGILPQGDWDSLGMRGSGSQSIRFERVIVAKSAVRPIGPWGRWSTGVLINRTLGNLVLVGAFLGIAEHAHEIAMAALATQTRLGRKVSESAGVQQTVGEMEITLATCRSVLQQAGAGVDRWLDHAARNPPTLATAHNLMKSYQSAKWVVNRGAIEIVDKAMDLVGGGAFMSAHPLSRLYRDVRSGPFMQPHAPTEIRGYVGQVALGLFPEY